MHTITIKTNSFDGNLLLSASGTAVELKLVADGVFTAEVPAGTCWLDTGARIGQSDIVFKVNDSGHVTSINPPMSAIACEATIEFKTVEIQICSANYEGLYRTSLNDGTDIDGATTKHYAAHAVVDQRFFIGNTARVAGSTFYAVVHADGTIETTNSAAARVSGNHLSFQTTEVDFVDVKKSQRISGYEPITGVRNVTVIRGLILSLVTNDQTVVRFMPY